MDNFLKLAPLLAICAVVIGWFVNNKIQDNRETRKEIWELIQNIAEKLEKLKKNAFEYHTGNIHNNTLAHTIKIEIQNIAHEIKLLDKLKIKNIDTCMVKIRKNITLRNFETSRFRTLQPNDPLLEKMLSDCDTLTREIKHAFKEKYH